MSILAVGSIALDSVETPFGAARDVLGGSATYLTLAARHFSDDVRLVGVVGNDFPEAYMNTLRRSGVDLRGLEVDEGMRTFAWSGRYHYDLGERDTLRTDLNALETFDPVLPEAYRGSRIVCLGNLAPQIQQQVLDQVEAPELILCDTMNYWIEHTPDELRAVLRSVDVLVINDAEARELSDEPNLVRAAHAIREMGPQTLIIKKGEHGALLFTEGGIFSAPAYPLEDIQDPTGAGDAFAGGVAGFLSYGRTYDAESFRRAIIYGSALASFVVERFGPERLLEIDEEDVLRRARAFRELARIPELEPLYST